MALASAFEDSRFSPLRKEELKEIKIEISVLSKLKPVEKVEEVEIGRDGLFRFSAEVFHE